MTRQDEPYEAPAGNVVEAIRRVMRDLPAIEKRMHPQRDGSEGGVKYPYRGIEEMTSHLQDLCAQHGVVFTPRVTDWQIDEITLNNRPWQDHRLMVVFTVYGPEGDHIEIGPVPGIGRDNADKGTNKAMTQAFKVALLQTFMVGDKATDNDGTTDERDPVNGKAQPQGPGDRLTKAQRDDLLGELGALKDRQQRDAVRVWMRDNAVPPLQGPGITAGQAEDLRDFVRRLTTQEPFDTAPESPQDAPQVANGESPVADVPTQPGASQAVSGDEAGTPQLRAYIEAALADLDPAVLKAYRAWAKSLPKLAAMSDADMERVMAWLDEHAEGVDAGRPA